MPKTFPQALLGDMLISLHRFVTCWEAERIERHSLQRILGFLRASEEAGTAIAPNCSIGER